MKEQLKTNNRGYLANPLNTENQSFGKWTQNFSDIPNFRFSDVFFQLSREKVSGYNAKSQQSNKAKNLQISSGIPFPCVLVVLFAKSVGGAYWI